MAAISQLNVYPIKSCAGIALDAARLMPYGLEYDRNWMVVDGDGCFITQRTFARLALVKVALGASELVISAPGMDELRTPLAAADLGDAAPVTATVWESTVTALDTGVATARWFSHFLGTPARLVHFDPAAERIASRKWTGELVVPVRFADGYPLLVAGQASLDDLNARLVMKGASAIPMNRFRPNLVVTGLDEYEEDYVDTFTIATDGGEVELRNVKPCARCPIPTIDQASGAPDPRWPNEPTDTMSVYRADSRLDGALTFGQNLVVVHGAGAMLKVGQAVEVELGFEE